MKDMENGSTRFKYAILLSICRNPRHISTRRSQYYGQNKPPGRPPSSRLGSAHPCSRFGRRRGACHGCKRRYPPTRLNPPLPPSFIGSPITNATYPTTLSASSKPSDIAHDVGRKASSIRNTDHEIRCRQHGVLAA